MATSLEAFSIFLVRCAQELAVLFVVLIRHPLRDRTYAIIVHQASSQFYILVTRSALFLSTGICKLHRDTSLLLMHLDDSPSVALSVWRTAQTIYSIYCTIAYVYVTLSAAFIISYLAAFCLIIDVVGRVFSYSSFIIFHQVSSAGDAIAICIEPPSQEGAAIDQPSFAATIKPLDPGHSEISLQEDVAINHTSSTEALTPLDLGYTEDGNTIDASKQEDVNAELSSMANITPLDSGSSEDRRNYLVHLRVRTSYCILWFLTFYLMYRWMNRGQEVGDNCWSDKMCRSGLICQGCAGVKTCVRATATNAFNIVDNSLPFNKYAFLTTHNSFSTTENPRYTLHNQEDLVNDQLLNGVRGLMLDVYDYQDDIWLCHSFLGTCFEPTAFEPAINTMRVIEAFLVTHPSEIVTLILEDHVKSHHGLSMLFNKTGLMRYWFPVSSMPRNGEDWPRVRDMIMLNHRLLVFTSNRSKESSEEIAYQWNYMVENQYGDAGMDSRWCVNRSESPILSDRTKSLVLVNYFRTYPDKRSACKEHSRGLMDVLHICYAAAGHRWANFLAVDYYKRSDGGGVFQATDMLNGMLVCGRDDIHKCSNPSWKESLLGPVFAAATRLKKLLPLPHDMFFFSEMVVILFYLMYLVDLRAGNEPGFRFKQRHPLNNLCATISKEARIWGWPWHEFGVM